MSTGKSTSSAEPTGRYAGRPIGRVPKRRAIGWTAAAMLWAVAPAATCAANQPPLAYQPMTVRGDTLHHIDTWDVRYGSLPELRVAALPQVAGPARTTIASATRRVAAVAAPQPVQNPAFKKSTAASSAVDTDVARKLAALPVAAVSSRPIARSTALGSQAERRTPAGTDLAKRLATLPVAAADEQPATPKAVPLQRMVTSAPVAADLGRALAKLPVVAADPQPAAPPSWPEPQLVRAAPVVVELAKDVTRLPVIVPPSRPIEPVTIPVQRSLAAAPLDAQLADGLAVADTTPSTVDRGPAGAVPETDASRIAPARFAQQNNNQPIPRPSYLDEKPTTDVVPPEPSYLEEEEFEKLTIEEQVARLQQRVFELESGRTAQEDATRTIIRQSFAERGSNITDAVVFGGTLETLTFWQRDFDDIEESDIVLDTAELDFEIQVNPWTIGSLVIEYEDGGRFSFLTDEDDAVFVDRVNVRQALITVGDITNYPPYMSIGRAVVPFGISTGDPVADVLTINDPLTVEIFETTEDFVMLGFVYPICCPPPLDPNAPPGPPPVEGILINPLVRRASTCMFSYCPCTPPPRPPTPPPWLPTCLPAFNTAIYFYNGDTIEGTEEHIEHIGGTIGYFGRGVLPYRGLPWSLDLDVDVTSSVFDSDFLQHEYRAFLEQIGYVPGMAAHAKVNVGPTAYIVEWNGAVTDAEFVDDAATPVSIQPRAWQISFAYQFGWHPLVEVIGAQGTYFTMGYSESADMAGATRAVGDPMAPTLLRVGNVPERRISVGVGEWVLPGLRVALEYSHEWDYNEGLGTGNESDGVFWQMTYEW